MAVYKRPCPVANTIKKLRQHKQLEERQQQHTMKLELFLLALLFTVGPTVGLPAMDVPESENVESDIAEFGDDYRHDVERREAGKCISLSMHF